MSDPVFHLIVEQGAEKGRKITVPPEGGRLGRSSKNDIVIVDPMMSRHHCRLFFKTNDGLWITDLGSSNATLVNNKPAQESPLRVGDTILVGETLLRVVNDGRGSAQQTVQPSQPAPPPAPAAATAPPIHAKRKTQKFGVRRLLLIEAVVIVIAFAVWLPKIRAWRNPPRPPPFAVAPAPVLEVEYEKVQADSSNIFRHHLSLSADGIISVQIDDPANNRHVRKEKPVDKDYLKELARTIVDTGFFDLDERYEGIQPDALESWDLSVTVGRRTHRTRVINRVEPEAFRNAREIVEQAGKNELGLDAMQFSTDKLLQMAQEAYLLGRKLLDEREIKYGNLSAAIRSLKEAEIYLETVEPKPEYYGELISAKSDAERMLTEKYEDQNFRASRAIRLREWEQAARELQIILELVPDRSDPRNSDARKRLLDVQSRMKEKK